VVRESGELYLPSEDAVADVDRAMNAARESDKLLLVVMGANWCHDSRALASRLFEEPLKSLIDTHYETVFVDVGYLDKGKEVISSIGPPVYYATPTVLIIDPANEVLVNAGNRHQWGDASRISMQASVEYFELMATPKTYPEADDWSQSLPELVREIDSWEEIQADRLYAAYAVLGPMLKAYKEGQSQESFEDDWNEVRDFRVQLARDIDALRQEARARVAADESNIMLEYPEYPSFSWEARS
jgi:hypothetical protein